MISWIAMAKEMALLAGLRAAVAVLALIGRELALSEAERRAILTRIEQGLLGGPVAPSAS
jgi:hypothetical protein